MTINTSHAIRRAAAAALALSAALAAPSGYAATTINVANGDDLAGILALAEAGDTVVVGPGTYECESQFTVDKAITLKSSDGPEATILRATTAAANADTRRALYISAAATVSGFTIEQNATSINSTRLGLTVYIHAAGAMLTNCVVRGNGRYYSNRVKGAGIAMDAAGDIVDCVVSNYFVRGARGGGVYMTAGTIRDSTITGCRAGNGNGEWNYGAYGAGLILYGAATASGCTISNNISPYYMGAGVCLYNNNAVLTNCVVTGNSTRFTSGAGVFNCRGKVVDCTIADNYMFDTGLRSDYQWLDGTITHSTSTSLLPHGEGNTWTQALPATIPSRVYCSPDGAEIFPYDTPENAATNLSIAVEAASAFARATATTVTVEVAAGTYGTYSCANVTDPLEIVGEGPDVTSVIARSNICRAMRIASTAAGSTVAGLSLRGRQALCSSDGDLTLTGGGYRGNGLLVEADTLVTNCLFSGHNNDNKAQMDGGALYANAGHIIDCEFSGNSSITKGLVYLLGTAEMDACHVVSNRCTYGYSAQDSFSPGVNLSGSAIMRNCLVANNTGIYGVAGVQLAGSAKMYHCTVVSNISSQLSSGAGLTIGNGQARSSIFAHNYSNGNASSVKKNGGSVAYCLTDTEISGTGNINATPSFVDLDAGNYRLALGSAGIDACASDYGIFTDLDGVVRPQDGDGDTVALNDMGCYEFVMSAEGVTALFAVTNGAAGIGSTTATFKATVVSGGETLEDHTGVAFLWTFYSPATGSNTVEGAGNAYALIERTFDVGGIYDVSLRVTTQDGEDEYFAPAAITVYADEMYVACDGSSTPSFPYSTPATAASLLNDASDAAYQAHLDAGLTNATIHLLGSGVFPISKTISAPFALSLLGQGPDATSITPASGFGSRALSSAGDLLVSGIKFRGFLPISAQEGSAIRVASSSATSVLITNCVFDACRNIGNPDGGALYVNASAGTDVDIVDCIIRNTITGNPAWRSTVYLAGSNVLMDRCVVTNNCSGDAGWKGQCISGVKLGGGAILRNCLVADNYTLQVDSSGGGRGAAVQASGVSQVENCTIVSNRTMYARLTSAVGLYMDGGSAVNCVVADNYDFGNSVMRDTTDANRRISYSAVEGIDYGEGNVASHVVFKDAVSRDWRLASGSPGVGEGANLGWVDFETDLLGSPRRLGARVDMGCYEAPAPGTFLLFK